MGSYIQKYSGYGITFSCMSGGIFVNATEMARVYDTSASQWLASKETESLINNTSNQLFQAVKFSTVIQPVLQFGRYSVIHSALAVAFAKSLCPEFGEWIQQCINNMSIGCFDVPGNSLNTNQQ